MPVGSKMIRELLENGTHFGHQTNKWNPKMKKYIFGEKSGIYIIDLEKTEKALVEALKFLEDLARDGKKVIFVGTKKQAKQIIRDQARRCGMFYVDERWLGGCLTNFNTIRKSVEKLDKLQEMKESEIYGSLAKKERVSLEREENKLLKNLRGVREMTSLPGAVIVIDAEAEKIAVREADKMGIPVIALMDTNCDPNMVDYPIPGNDDAIKSISYICTKLADAVCEGRGEYDAGAAQEEKEAEETKPAETAERPPEEAKKEAEAEEEAAETAEKPAEETAEEEEESVYEDEEIEGDISLG